LLSLQVLCFLWFSTGILRMPNVRVPDTPAVEGDQEHTLVMVVTQGELTRVMAGTPGGIMDAAGTQVTATQVDTTVTVHGIIPVGTAALMGIILAGIGLDGAMVIQVGGGLIHTIHIL
jgi:hypothetical protein